MTTQPPTQPPAVPTAPIPEVPMPRSALTLGIITGELDGWWASLTPGQKMHINLTHVPVTPEEHPS